MKLTDAMATRHTDIARLNVQGLPGEAMNCAGIVGSGGCGRAPTPAAAALSSAARSDAAAEPPLLAPPRRLVLAARRRSRSCARKQMDATRTLKGRGKRLRALRAGSYPTHPV